MSGRAARKARAIILRVWFGLNIPFGTRRLSRRVHRARRKAERALALTCVATGGAHTPAPTRAVCEACGISKLRVVRGGGQL